MFPNPGVLQRSLPHPARAEQSHSPALPFLRWDAFSSDLDTLPCPSQGKGHFHLTLWRGAPAGNGGKALKCIDASQGEGENVPSRDPHTRRLAPVTGAAVTAQPAPLPPAGVSLRGCPPPPCPSRPVPAHAAAPHPPHRCHHHCITPSRHSRRGSRLGNTTPRNHCLTQASLLLQSPAQGSALQTTRSDGRGASAR